MQLTIDIPDELAPQAEAARERLSALVRRAIEQNDQSGVLQDVFLFLASNPSPEEIIAYHPPAKAVQRLGTLLDKKREAVLTSDEEAELDTMQSLNNLFAYIKLRARQQLPGTA